MAMDSLPHEVIEQLLAHTVRTSLAAKDPTQVQNLIALLTVVPDLALVARTLRCAATSPTFIVTMARLGRADLVAAAQHWSDQQALPGAVLEAAHSAAMEARQYNVLRWIQLSGYTTEPVRVDVGYKAAMRGDLDTLEEWAREYGRNDVVQALNSTAKHTSPCLTGLQWFVANSARFDIRWSCIASLQGAINNDNLAIVEFWLDLELNHDITFKPRQPKPTEQLSSRLPDALKRHRWSILRQWLHKRAEGYPRWSRVTFSSGAMSMDLLTSAAQLEWWVNEAKFPVEYSEAAMHKAVRAVDAARVQWWFDSGLPLKYDPDQLLMDSATYSCGPEVLTILHRHQVPVTPTARVIDTCRGGETLTWWRAHCADIGVDFPYTEVAIHRAFYRGDDHVLKWWLNSGLPLKYTHRAVELAICSWSSAPRPLWVWEDAGLPLRYRGLATEWAKVNPHKRFDGVKQEVHVKRLFDSHGWPLEGGLPAPAEYCLKEEGEDDVFTDFYSCPLIVYTDLLVFTPPSALE